MRVDRIHQILNNLSIYILQIEILRIFRLIVMTNKICSLTVLTTIVVKDCKAEIRYPYLRYGILMRVID